MIPCFSLCICFFHFSTSLYLCDFIFILLLRSWFEFLLVCACEFTWFKFSISFYLPLCFSSLHLRLYFYLLSNTLSIFIYLSPHFSPCFCVLHSLQLSLHQYLFLSLCLSISINLSISIFFMFLYPYATLSVTISSTLIHSLFMCVSLISIDSIFPFLFVSISCS